MPNLIENRPIGCHICHYGPIFGREDKMNTPQGILLEVRWVCPKCGSLVRVDEEYVNETEK